MHDNEAKAKAMAPALNIAPSKAKAMMPPPQEANAKMQAKAKLRDER